MSPPDRAAEPAGPLQARAQQTRQHILDLASTAFAERGFDGTPLNEIVRRSGLTKGAFYFHFASKEALAFAAFEQAQRRFVEHLAREAAGAPDGLAAIGAIFRARARLMASEPSFRVILRLGGRLSSLAEPDSAYARQADRPIAELAALVRRGQGEGCIRRELDPRRAAEGLFAAILGVDEVSSILSGFGDLARRSEDMVDLLSNGLAARPRRGKARRARAPAGSRARAGGRRRP